MPQYKTLDRLLLSRPAAQVTLLGLVLTVLVGTLDYATGNEISFSIFYLIPVALVTWYASALSGYAISCICAAVGLIVDLRSGYTMSDQLIHFWNAVVRLGFFGITARLLALRHTHLDSEKRLANTDSLTQLLNVQGLKQEADRLLQLAGRYQHPITVGLIDLDNFTAINDARGRAEGDRVLQTVAQTLDRRVRLTDLVARVSGDEFVVVLAETPLTDARVMFNRIRQDLAAAAEQADWPVGFSIGVAAFTDAPTSVEQALKVADRLVYGVKAAGKNNIAFETQGRGR